MIFARCSLITVAKKSARETRGLLQYHEMCKQPSNSFRRYVYKETGLKIHSELSNIIRLCSNFSMRNETVLPRQTQVVICGAGTVANSVAYHLVQNGWNDILVLEQKKWDYFAVFDDIACHFFYTCMRLYQPFSGRCIHWYFLCVSVNWFAVFTLLMLILVYKRQPHKRFPSHCAVTSDFKSCCLLYFHLFLGYGLQ